MKAITERVNSARSTLGRLLHRRSYQVGTARVGASRTQVDQSILACSGWERGKAQISDVVAQGVIKREEIPLLTRYGTAYGLFDEWIADYSCVLNSDAYRLGEYVGDSVRVSGPLTEVIGGMPVIEVIHLQLLKMKWMR